MRRKKPDPAAKARVLEDVARLRANREQGYREKALALFPHVCGRCGREFEGNKLRELTVHHKDSDHMNNPADGSNWELLCIYCHDQEHEAHEQRGSYGAGHGRTQGPTLGHSPFEGLGNLLPPGEDSERAD